MKLTQIIKPSLTSKLRSGKVPNFLPALDTNTQHQADIWSNKTYQVNPKTHVFTTIQEHFCNRLLQNVKLPPHAVVLDIGCFLGEKLWQFKNNDGHLGIGIDIAASALQTAQRIDPYGNNYLMADLLNLPFKNKSIDLALAFDVIEHLTDAQKGFSELSRVLKPGGRLLLHGPISNNTLSLFWWKQQLFSKHAQNDYLDVGHTPERMPSSKLLENYLQEHGFKIDRELYYNSFFVHFWDREFSRIMGGLFLRFLNKKSSKTHVQPDIRSNKTRQFYGKYIVPVLEVLSWPDKLLSHCHVGNTLFVFATKL